MKLTRLKIDKYRRVLPGTELVFDDGLNVPLGRNGTGKTTLLDLLSMCVRSNFEKLAQEEIAFDYDLQFDESLVHVRVENRKREALPTSSAAMDDLPLFARSADPQFEYEVIVEIRLESPQKTYRLRATPSSSQLDLEGVGGPRHVHAIEAISPLTKGFVSLAILKLYQHFMVSDGPIADTADSAVLSALATMSLPDSGAYRFDESLAAFRAMGGRPADETSADPPISFIRLRRESGGSFTTTTWRFVPLSIITHVEERLNTSGAIADITLGHKESEFLDRFVGAARLSSAEMKIALRKREVSERDEQLIVGDFKFILHFKDGTAISQEFLSYGQKRLLAFLYYADCADVVIADEIVNGLHHDWIDACLDAIGKRQAFLTSQNPLLLDYLSFESAEQAEKCFILCRTEVRDGRDHMRWANITKQEAETFYRGYLAGIQHVSELLRTEGLW
jgi:AAA domain, putative AbiEii toxin, Type IV TA system